ncbi:hypothetical protein [Undibacterium sp.]|jgi:hypothetical protein|uniref:hypothetical protein n=1 Tax=Undibacterium sp. TaxID=1914977 RepID=UPI002D009E3A|nr:hypothetical protein [Undibacterium sp.]HTD05167.1 hypothetical protein [Undibacterium sp.]
MNTENTGPIARPDKPLPRKKHDEAGKKKAHEEEALDEGLDESFPASDPVAVTISRSPKKSD